MPYSIDGPWTGEEEDELLELYGLERVEGLDEVWQLARPGPGGAQVFARSEALEWIRQVRRVAYGMGG